MKKSISIPAFIFKSGYGENTTSKTIKRQDDVLELEFPIFQKNEVLEVASRLAKKKRRAHNRHIDEVLDIIDQVGNLWRDPNYDIRKEVLEVLPIMTGQSKKLCEVELDGTLEMWDRKYTEIQLKSELGGKEYLEEWVQKRSTRIHAQPRGLILHNMAGNAFNLGMLSLFYGLITKNVNLIKLSHGEPFMAIKLCESIADVDDKIAKEIAALYWRGSKTEIYDALFNSGWVDGVLAWGGIHSIEEIRRRANRFGIKIIDHGPKISFSVISESIFKDKNKMEEIAQKIAVDAVCWNQKACLSPRVIYIMDDPQESAVYKEEGQNTLSNKSQNDRKTLDNPVLDSLSDIPTRNNENGTNIETLMQRSIKQLRNQYSELSPMGFAKMLADGLKLTDKILPRANLTHSDGLSVERKREYFFMNYVTKKRATILTPPMDKLDWTVVFLRDLPNRKEIDMCQNRFLIVTRISSIEDLIHSIRKEKLQRYLQTVSIYGSDNFIKEVAEELSLAGAYRFPKVGEHNNHPIGMPWDGHYVLQDLTKWVYIGHLDQKVKEEDQLSFFNDLDF
ncbi:MAG: acyl-CoA reductase [Promethearchaeia archaeon]